MQRFRKILVANRSEIAIRVFRAASELGIATVAIYAEQDKLSLHRFKADEAYPLDPDKGPVAAYLAIDDIVRIALAAGADAVHPGYGLLSESPEFAEACAAAGLCFIGPASQTMRDLGDKVSARRIAVAAGVPVVPASEPLPGDDAAIVRIAETIGYPLMLKASWGGGGRGMRPVRYAADLLPAVHEGRREARAAFGRDEVYLERLIADARHVEVQILGDAHGGLVHLYERDCTIQRRNQKVIERAPAPYLDDSRRAAICEAALRIGRFTRYENAGTVEFLLDRASGDFYFIEVNPRIQVEHTITEAVTGLDIVKAQIRIAGGAQVGRVDDSGIPAQSDIALHGHAIQCRVTTENPENSFIPDYGRITAYRGAFGNGIRIDGGTAYSGAVVTRFYDPLLEKIISWAPSAAEAGARMVRALREYRIRGVATNLRFLENLLVHPAFLAADYNTRFIDSQAAELNGAPRRDRATRLLRYIAEVTVNGHPDVAGRATPAPGPAPEPLNLAGAPPPGARQILEARGAAGFADWMRSESRLLVTDTTMRDAHQSLLATRMRTYDMERIAPDYARGLPQLLSVECWGGATFDVAMRFLSEDPWERLDGLRARMPNLLTQMLIRGANAVGYANYPDNAVRHFIGEAARGIDIFRIFDCFNWVENMRVAIDAVAESGKLAEGAICYTGDVLDPARDGFDLGYYCDVARQLDAAGCHIIAIKDMAGLLTPASVRALIAALRDVTDKPIHLHTHDTSGAAAATLIAAAEVGVDAVDAAMDSLSGLTSQPCLGSVVHALRHGARATQLDAGVIARCSGYWDAVRRQYAAFEADLRSGASEVYRHEMPGGQFTNLKEQARAVGLEGRWPQVAEAYREANLLFGDIIKVTPSSKVVGDMALAMVSQGVSARDIENGNRAFAFPASVKAMMRGDLGQPHRGFPPAIQELVLGDAASVDTRRPSARLAPADLDKLRGEVAEILGRKPGEADLASFIMYPDVFSAFVKSGDRFGPVARLPTPCYFYGMRCGDEIVVDLDVGKRLHIVLHAIGDRNDAGERKLFFELNGQPRTMTVTETQAEVAAVTTLLADDRDPRQIAAPMPGMISMVAVAPGSRVAAGATLFSIEAMKMESAITAPVAGVINRILVEQGQLVEPKQLLCVIADDE
jgi:pyruvate carboxylase